MSLFQGSGHAREAAIELGLDDKLRRQSLKNSYCKHMFKTLNEIIFRESMDKMTMSYQINNVNLKYYKK